MMAGKKVNAKQAVAARIKELRAEKKTSINAVANWAGVPPTTIYSIMNKKSKNPGIITIQQVCDGLNITIREFFDSPIFEEVERETD